MDSSWLIDIVDRDKSMVRLRNAKTNLGKAYFFPKLKQAELKGTKLIANCEDGIWELDILTSVRRKSSGVASSKLKASSSSSPLQDIPFFLRKK